jgi:tetratricopeptide (TPR) repeat protein
VFLSHTGDLRRWPADRTWVAAAEDAVKRLRHAPVDMSYFTADDRPPAQMCAALVAGSDLYIGIIGPRYGSPVRDDPERSYTELEFDTATEHGKRRLVFLIASSAGGAGPDLAADPWTDRQARFRQRLLDSGVTVNMVDTAAALETGIVQAVAQLMLAEAVDVRPGAARAAPTPAGGARVPRQLPAEAAAFTDRVRQFERLSTLLSRPDEHRPFVAVVTGPAGVGKTSFAVHVAHRVRDRFPDGQLYVDLRGYSALPTLAADEALDGFVRAFDAAPERVPTDTAGLTDAYRTALDGRRVLVILDNALTSEQVRPLLPPAGSAALVTSRGPLSGLIVREGAVRMALEPLDPPHAEALLRTLTAIDNADEADDADTAALAELARQCGYLPLALRIAAEQAALTGLGPADLVDALAGERGRLDALTGLDDDPSSQVRTVISWSYRNLAEPLAHSFRLLALHPGGEFGVPVAAALFGVPVPAALRTLDTLVAFNVVERPRRGRYRFHDLVRAYATERMEEDEPETDRQAAFDRELDWYVHTADAADRLLAPMRRHVPLEAPRDGSPPVRLGGHDEALRWCDDERDTLVALVRLAAERDRPQVAWRLALAAVTYFVLRRRHPDWLASMEVAAEAARAAGEPLGEAWSLTSLGGACLALGFVERARQAYEQSLRLHRQISDRIGEGMALSNLGEVAMMAGRYDDALDYGRAALAIWSELGDRRSEALALLDAVAPVHFALGEYSEAARIYQRALDACQGVDRGVEGQVLHELGRTNHALGRYEDASERYDQALRMRRSAGDRVGEAETLQALATSRRALDDQIGAQSALLQALAIFVEHGRDAAAEQVRAGLRDLGLDPGGT